MFIAAIIILNSLTAAYWISTLHSEDGDEE